LRFLGGTIGISVGQAIYESGLRARLPSIQGYNPGQSGMTNDVRSLINIEPESVRDQVLHAYTRSLALIWIVYCACNFVGLLLVLPIRAYSLKRAVVQHGEKQTDATPSPAEHANSGDVEKAHVGGDANVNKTEEEKENQPTIAATAEKASSS